MSRILGKKKEKENESYKIGFLRYVRKTIKFLRKNLFHLLNTSF